MTTTTRRPQTAEVAEAVDAAVHNYRAGNHQTAQTHALMAILHLLTDEQPKPEPVFQFTINTKHDTAVPTQQGVYQDRNGLPWWRTAVESDRPWMDLTHGHSEDRWFTDQYAAQYAPFTRMVAVA